MEASQRLAWAGEHEVIGTVYIWTIIVDIPLVYLCDFPPSLLPPLFLPACFSLMDPAFVSDKQQHI